jgi:hypothetical protein
MQVRAPLGWEGYCFGVQQIGKVAHIDAVFEKEKGGPTMHCDGRGVV